MVGRYLTDRLYESSEEVIRELALDQSWENPNTATHVVNVVIPKGTLVYQGIVGPQGDPQKYPGGGHQIFVPDIWNNKEVRWGTPRPVGH
jgi:hypothetical protein